MAIHITENIPLASLTTFQIGGQARYFVKVSDVEEVQEAIAWALEQGVGFFVLAGGSNVLVPDEGIDGLVIHLVGSDFVRQGAVLDCNAGCDLLRLIRAMSVEGFGGWEKLAGIPGSVGGGVRGGIGAFGSEIKDFVTKVRALHSVTGVMKDFSNAECNFSYRHSFFKEHPEWVIFQAEVKLSKVRAADSTVLIEQTIAEREKRHLQDVRAAGSFFMNPVASQNICEQFEKEKGVQSRENRVPAGWLVEKAGMKGVRVGGAQSSMQHANYIVNTGNATASDVRALAEQIKRAVKKQFAVDLQEEACVVPHSLPIR